MTAETPPGGAGNTLEAAATRAYAAVIAHQREAREELWRAPSHRQVQATIREQYDRAQAAEAKLAEIRQAIATYFTVHGNSAGASLTLARDLGEGIRQIIDRETAHG